MSATAPLDRDQKPAVLTESGDLVRPAMRAAVDRLDPINRSVVEYHLGWTEPDGGPPSGGGKGVRPALALLAAQACGADRSDAVPGAVAVELVHNFSLLHDDVIDRDTERRHRRTVWAQWGDTAAILAGDALLALAIEVVLESDSRQRAQAAGVLLAATRRLIDGETHDVAFERRHDVTLAECLEMVEKKTGALLSASAAIGGLFGGAPPETVRVLADFGVQLGVIFQLVDDILGIWGDPARTGKPVGSDLTGGKKTLPVTYAMENGGATGRELTTRLAGRHDDANRGDLDELVGLVEAAGGRRWAEAEARRRLGAAERVLATGLVGYPTGAPLLELAHYVLGRDA